MNQTFIAIIDGAPIIEYNTKEILTVGNQIQFKSHLEFQNNPKSLP